MRREILKAGMVGTHVSGVHQKVLVVDLVGGPATVAGDAVAIDHRKVPHTGRGPIIAATAEDHAAGVGVLVLVRHLPDVPDHVLDPERRGPCRVLADVLGPRKDGPGYLGGDHVRARGRVAPRVHPGAFAATCGRKLPLLLAGQALADGLAVGPGLVHPDVGHRQRVFAGVRLWGIRVGPVPLRRPNSTTKGVRGTDP